VGREGVRERGAVAVGEPADRVGIQGARGGARAEQGAAEARALLVGPVHEPERERARLVGERAQDLEAGEDVQRAVEPAPVRDGIQVAAEDDGPLGVARQRRPGVPRGVPVDLDARDPVELGAQPVAGGDPRVGPGDALGAVLVPGQPRSP
jgi:hypothetical protein